MTQADMECRGAPRRLGDLVIPYNPGMQHGLV